MLGWARNDHPTKSPILRGPRMSRVQPRTYEVEEANTVLPQVRRLVEQVVELGTALPDLEDQARIAQYRRSRPDATDVDRAQHERGSEDLRQAEVELAGALEPVDRGRGC